MAKIPFTLEAWLKDKSQRVETKSGFPAIILHCDGYGESPILVTVDLGDGRGVQTRLYFADGKLYKEESDADLFIVTPEEELTEFEKGLVMFYRTRGEIQPDKDGVFNRHEVDELLHKAASELLALAREQFIKDGYVIEKKIFHDAVKKIDPGIMKEVSKNVDMQIALRTEYEKGRADTLKDLPRWRKIKAFDVLPCPAYLYKLAYEQESNYGEVTIPGLLFPNDAVQVGCDTWYLPVDDIQNLPKED